MQSLLDASADPALVVRQSGEEVTIIGGNEAAAKLAGSPLEDLMRRRLSSVLPEDAVAAIASRLAADEVEPAILFDQEAAVRVRDAFVTVRLTPTDATSDQRLGVVTLPVIPPSAMVGPHETILERVAVPVLAAGPDNLIVFANEAAAELTGRPVLSLLGMDMRRIATADDWSLLAHHLAVVETAPFTIEIDHHSGKRRVARVSVGHGDGLVTVTLEDRTHDQVDAERIAEMQALDPLTGLANRVGLASYMDALAGTSDGRSLTVAFLDLDNFKTINDALGHDHGDIVLETVGRRLADAVGSFGLVARPGGDEFVVACSFPAEAGATELEHLVAQPFTEPIALGDRSLKITASVGIAAAAEPGEAPQRVLKAADLAMYEAKRRGKNRVAVYDDSLEHRASERLEIESELRSGIEKGELTVHYQPVVDVMTGKPVAAEALVRWIHPEQGPISPARFIPVAEQTGLIGPIGAFVLETALIQMSRWNRDRIARRPLSIGVNISGVQMIDPGLGRSISAALSRSGLDPAKLTIEITESTLMTEAASNLRTLDQLADLGISIAIDDFGTGYSSLAYLKRLPAQILKIDREFVEGLGTIPEDTALVTGIVSLASALNLRVVAEGVENELQLKELRRIGCEASQGYFHAKPMPAAEFEEWVRSFYEPAVDAADASLGTSRLVPDIEAASDPLAPVAGTGSSLARVGIPRSDES